MRVLKIKNITASRSCRHFANDAVYNKTKGMHCIMQYTILLITFFEVYR